MLRLNYSTARDKHLWLSCLSYLKSSNPARCWWPSLNRLLIVLYTVSGIRGARWTGRDCRKGTKNYFWNIGHIAGRNMCSQFFCGYCVVSPVCSVPFMWLSQTCDHVRDCDPIFCVVGMHERLFTWNGCWCSPQSGKGGNSLEAQVHLAEGVLPTSYILDASILIRIWTAISWLMFLLWG